MYFGNYYVGYKFSIDVIEATIDQKRKIYKESSQDQKIKGLEVEFDERQINWKDESIIFPFSPKKHINTFTNKGKVFMSKQKPLFLIAEVRNQNQTQKG